MPVKSFFDGAEVYSGKFDQSILSFLPERSCWRQLIANRDAVICKNHPKQQGDKYIAPGDKVVAVKWQSGRQDDWPFWRVFFYCSKECQESHKRVRGKFSPIIKK